MQIIDILGDDMNVKIVLEFDEKFMCGIGFDLQKLPSSLVIKFMYQIRIPQETRHRGYLIDIVAFPQSVCISKCFDSTLSANPGTGKDYKFLFHTHKVRKILLLPKRSLKMHAWPHLAGR